MAKHLLQRPLFCQNAEAHLKQNYSKDFQDQLWIRDAFTNSALDHGAIVVYGHTISEQAELLPNRIGLDTEQRLLQTGVDK
jgi:hypothetical protein